jgi:hypothetical protein
MSGKTEPLGAADLVWGVRRARVAQLGTRVRARSEGWPGAVHGHAVIARLDDFGLSASLLHGHDNKTGWMSSTLGKVRMYDACADACKNKEVVIHSFATYTQLAHIDGSTLRAPEGQHDDRADAFALACAARLQMPAADDDYFEPVLISSGFQPLNYPAGRRPGPTPGRRGLPGTGGDATRDGGAARQGSPRPAGQGPGTAAGAASRGAGAGRPAALPRRGGEAGK